MQYRQAEYNLPVDAKCLLFYWVSPTEAMCKHCITSLLLLAIVGSPRECQA